MKDKEKCEPNKSIKHRDLLKYYDEGWRYLTKDEDGDLNLHKSLPKCDSECWYSPKGSNEKYLGSYSLKYFDNVDFKDCIIDLEKYSDRVFIVRCNDVKQSNIALSYAYNEEKNYHSVQRYVIIHKNIDPHSMIIYRNNYKNVEEFLSILDIKYWEFIKFEDWVDFFNINTINISEKWAIKLDFQEGVDYTNENGIWKGSYGFLGFAHFPPFSESCTASLCLHDGYRLLTKEEFFKKIYKKEEIMKKKEIYFEIGQKVYDVRFGNGVVTQVDVDDVDYPITVKFDTNDNEGFTFDGKYHINDENPSLFQVPPIITQNVPIIIFEKGEKVWVRTDTMWHIRYYSNFLNNQHHVFIDQNKEGVTSCNWFEIRKFEDCPL